MLLCDMTDYDKYILFGCKCGVISRCASNNCSLLHPLIRQVSNSLGEESRLEADGYTKVEPGLPLAAFGVAGETRFTFLSNALVSL